jgi:hypothetical protein
VEYVTCENYHKLIGDCIPDIGEHGFVNDNELAEADCPACAIEKPRAETNTQHLRTVERINELIEVEKQLREALIAVQNLRRWIEVEKRLREALIAVQNLRRWIQRFNAEFTDDDHNRTPVGQ